MSRYDKVEGKQCARCGHRRYHHSTNAGCIANVNKEEIPFDKMCDCQEFKEGSRNA